MASQAAAAALQGGSGLVPSAYADAFVRGPPREGVQRVQTRLHKARILTDELADYFAARRELEGAYLKALQKVARRSFLSDPAALGPNFTSVYERLVAEIGEVARIHGDLERKLEQECELPMRNASSQGEWARIKEHDDNLSGTLREINSLESQLSKDQKKAETASSKKAAQAHQKVQETERSLRQTMELWEAEAPFAYEAYQRIDAQRLSLMKETVAKFETAQSDAAQRLMGMTEQSMQTALNFDPQVDMQEFVLRSATAKNATAPSRAAATNDNHRAPPASAARTPQPPSRQVSEAGGSTLGLGEFGRATSRHSRPSIDQPVASEQPTATKQSGGGSTLKNALSRFGRGRSNRDRADSNTQTIYGALPDSTSPSMRPPSITPGRNVSTDELSSVDSSADRRGLRNGAAAAAGAAAVAAGAGGLLARRKSDANSFMQPLTPTRMNNTAGRSPQPESSQKTPTLPQIDSEGFSIPPPDRKPWETSNMSVSPGAVGNEADPMGTITPRTAAMSIAQRPVQDNADQDRVALERMRSTLLSAGAPGAVPHRRNTSRRDRRDVRNTTYNPVMDSANRPISTFGLPGVDTASSRPSPSVFAATPGRSMSMVSSGSQSNIGNATLESVSGQAAPAEPGLHAFITERVNVIMNGRDISKVMVVGELAVTAKDVPATEPLDLRIDAFEQLEKAAANPQFLKETCAGEYKMDVASIARQGGATAAGRGTVLKYQVHVPMDKASEYVPFHVIPQWRCEAQQTSILVNYSVNPSTRLLREAGAHDATIRDVVMAVDVTSPSVSNLMSKPTAVYSSEQKKLVWRLQEPIALGSAQGNGSNGNAAAMQNKALARFHVDAQSEVRPIDVRWRLPGLSVSTLGVSIVESASAAGVQFASITRSVVSGKHLASP